jgi:uncharacterized iron-regulated membrane protein
MNKLPQYLEPIFVLTFMVCLFIIIAGIYLYWIPKKDSVVDLTSEQKLKRKLVEIVGLGGTIAFILLFFLVIGVLIFGIFR